MTRFFVLDGSLCHDESEFDFDGGEWSRIGETPRCNLCGTPYAMLPLIPPLKGLLVADGGIFDLSKTTGCDVLISESCLKAFHDHGIRGLIEPQQIEFLGVEGPHDLKTIGTYFLARVDWGAEIDRSASALRTRPQITPCPNCGFAGSIERYDRVVIIDSSWDGRDFFSVKGLPGVVMVTERVRNLCRDSNLAVCKLSPAEEYSTPWLRKRS